MPLVDFEKDEDGINAMDVQLSSDSPIDTSPRRTRLSKYLDDLNLRPNDPPYDLNEANFRNSISGGFSASSVPLGLASLSTQNSLSALDPLASDQNPESDSFTYIETLLESLAILGKLGTALDVVAQKLPQEIYSLVDLTIEEVAERAEFGRRGSIISSSMMSGPMAGRLEDVYLVTASGPANALGSGFVSVAVAPSMSLPVNAGALSSASSLRLAALEASSRPIDQEVMKDLFWTMYSKLVALSEGLRVVYEVANRIGSVCIFLHALLVLGH